MWRRGATWRRCGSLWRVGDLGGVAVGVWALFLVIQGFRYALRDLRLR